LKLYFLFSFKNNEWQRESSAVLIPSRVCTLCSSSQR
jgi:hypothetical protein